MPKMTKTLTHGGLKTLMQKVYSTKYGFKNPVFTVEEITKSEALAYPTSYFTLNKLSSNKNFYRVTLEYDI